MKSFNVSISYIRKTAATETAETFNFKTTGLDASSVISKTSALFGNLSNYTFEDGIKHIRITGITATELL